MIKKIFLLPVMLSFLFWLLNVISIWVMIIPIQSNLLLEWNVYYLLILVLNTCYSWRYDQNDFFLIIFLNSITWIIRKDFHYEYFFIDAWDLKVSLKTYHEYWRKSMNGNSGKFKTEQQWRNQGDEWVEFPILLSKNYPNWKKIQDLQNFWISRSRYVVCKQLLYLV